MTTTEARTGTLHWSETGDVSLPGLLLVHSLGTDSTMWAGQVPVLSTVRRVVTVDLPGHGRSAAGPGPYRLEDLGRDLLDVATAAGHERFDVCGISIGGLIALWLAIDSPERVRSVIACNTAARLGSQALWSARIDAVLANGMEAIRPAVVTRFFAADFASRHPETFADTNRVFATTDPVGYAGCCAALRDSDLSDMVEGVTRPTLIVTGDQDVAAPPAQAAWLHSRIDRSRLEVIPGAAHLSNLDQPLAFNRAVSEALTATG